MGEAAKKLKAWCGYEFGKGVGDAPGNCHQCAIYHQRKVTADHQFKLDQAERTGIIPDGLSFDPPKSQTPCHVCPKMALRDDWQPGEQRGLLPANNLAVEIYYYASDDQRIGLFECAPLMRTLRPEAVTAMLDEFAVYFPTWLHRKNMLTKVLTIDQVATEVRGEKEERDRKSREATTKAEAQREKSKEGARR